MKRKPLFWILRHNEDGRVLCIDNKRRSKASGVEEIKKYKNQSNAMKRAGFTFACHAVNDGDCLDCCGRITEAMGWQR
jgi:hypothetical protein